MMAFTDERIGIEGRFQTLWGDANPTIPISWENVPFKRPGPSTPFIALTIAQAAPTEQITLGNNPLFRSYGVIHFNIYVPQMKGAKAADAIGDQIAAIFNSATFVQNAATIYCEAAKPHPVGPRDGRYLVIVTVPYHCDSYTS